MKIEIKERWFQIAVYLYLYIPIVLFLVTWITPLLSVVALIGLAYLAINILQKGSGFEKNIIIQGKIIWVILAMILLFLWCILSGQGGFISQASDWNKHNAILNDLIQIDWPVKYSFDGQSEGVLAYYIAEYLVPAAFGKIGGIRLAEIVMLLWVYVGLVLLCLGIALYIYAKNSANYVMIVLGVILFSTLIEPMEILYNYIRPLDSSESSHWISSMVMIQYSSNIVSLRWVFPQCVTAWIAVMMLLIEQKHIEKWGFICLPIIMYSTFVFLGLILLIGLYIVGKILLDKTVPKEIFSKMNLITIGVSFIFILYLGCMVIQPKTGNAGMNLEVIDYTTNIVLFILFSLTWILWYVVLCRKERYNLFFWSAAVVLLFLPFFSMGRWNDLCMRTSIPALFVICLSVIKNLLDEQNHILYKGVLVMMLLIGSHTSVLELKDAYINNTGYAKDYRCLNDLFLSQPFTQYQYVDWNYKNDLNIWILRK